MANPIVQFVDSISTTAALRYDFAQTGPNFRTLALGADAIDFGVPSFDGEPEGVGGRYGYRQIQFTQRIMGTRAVALARMSVLAKELLRATNYLRFQWDPSASPVFFKTYRAQPGTLSLENAGSTDAWDIIVPLEADPFAYGPRVTITTAQIIQAPADLTGPVRTAMRLVLPAIKGEAPTPLRVTLSPAASGNAVGRNSSWLIACIAGTTSMADTIIDIGTGDTVINISGTAGASTDATYFGGSYRAVTIGAASPNLLSRFSMTLPTTIPVGRYKVMLRCRFIAATAGTLLFRLQQGINSSTVNVSKGLSAGVDTIVTTDSGRNFWVDLGDINLPFGVNPAIDAAGNMPTPLLIVDIGTASGAASSVNVDAVKLMPVDGPQVSRTTSLRITGPAAGFAGFGASGTLDGDLETTWMKVTSTSNYIEGGTSLKGAFPVADPAAAQNLLIVMAMDSGQGSASGTDYVSTLNAQTAVDVSYFPRYLHIGDGT